MRAWHFVGDKLRDGSPIPDDGVKLVHTGDVIPCESGLHASEHPFDALRYAPGPILCLVKCGGVIVPHGNPVDKIACSERTIIARMDATGMLRYFARMRALSVIHLWDAPQLVCDYLMTGDESIRDAAQVAAKIAAAPGPTSWVARNAAWAAWAASSRNAVLAAWAASSRNAALAAWAASSKEATLAAAGATQHGVLTLAWAAARDAFAALVSEFFQDYS